MTEVAKTEKVDPETLVLRAKPRQIVRFKRNILVGAAAVGCVAILGVTWLGLGSPDHAPTPSQELYDPDKASDMQKPKPDQFQSLPKTYADIPAGVPVLGPPLPGDLGKPILEAQQAYAMSPAYQPVSVAPTDKSHESGVFFQTSPSGADVAPAAFAPVEDADLSGDAPAATAIPVSQGSEDTGQAHKLAFVSAGARGDTVNKHSLASPISPYQVMAGTVIAASLLTGLNSDLPGMVIAQVTEPVFDSVSGRILLIPQGARLIGAYDSAVSFGQSRALLVWKRIVMPDGSSLEIDNLPATDTGGFAGLEDRVDYHTGNLLAGIGLSTLLGMTAVGGSDNDSDLVRALRESTRDTANSAGQTLVSRTLDIQPSLRVRPGWPLRVIVHKDLVLKPYAE